MRISTVSRYVTVGAALVALGILALSAPAASQSAGAVNGRLGFVVSDINYAHSDTPRDATTCPNGFSIGYREIFARSPAGQRREGESDSDYTRRLDQAGYAGITVNGENLCMHPELGSDPNYRTMTSRAVTVLGGIDLDGQESRANGRAAPGTCAHDDFRGPNGQRGIDNQFFRATGCNPAALLARGESGLTIEMLTGSWGILVTLTDVDDLRNDESVEVGLAANADPIQLSANRVPLANVTYATDPDPRFRATAHGRIRNGVLTTDPVDLRFHTVLNGMRLERPLRDARLRATFAADGAIEGFLAGYTPVVEMYDMSYGFRNGRTTTGELSPLGLRQGSANGASVVLNRTCEGAWAALHQLADGHRDPQTGECTSISTQYRFRAIPAFVVDTPTRSVNAALNH